jgi:hypothetical protein
MLSVAPPAGNGTTKRIGLFGNVLCAYALSVIDAQHTIVAAMKLAALAHPW